MVLPLISLVFVSKYVLATPFEPGHAHTPNTQRDRFRIVYNVTLRGFLNSQQYLVDGGVGGGGQRRQRQCFLGKEIRSPPPPPFALQL